MMFVIYPLELILVIFLGLGLFKFFVWLLNSPKLDRTIEKVVHPNAISDDEVIEKVEDTLTAARERAEQTEQEAEKKRAKAARLRKSYGGK